MAETTIKSITISHSSPLCFILGPCAIESEPLVMQVAEEVARLRDELHIPVIFKSSFDKANRSSIHSYRGPGMEKGLAILKKVAEHFDLPLTTDIHTAAQAVEAARVVDLLQVPAFLCRQTDLLVAAAGTGKAVNVKKGQFLSPWETKNIITKLRESNAGGVLLTERGSSFGYQNLVVDMKSIEVMRSFDVPVVFDATHSVQQPGGMGTSTGGQREFIPTLSKAAVAAGADAVFMEVHPSPSEALSDGTNMWPLAEARALIEELLEIAAVVRK
jgi:2-dehydro-3-deoxyphosphooctonate aldolase (KDO 8-P synthase)